MKSGLSAHERIHQAAFELMSDKGYTAVSTREIALRAGVAEITIFRQFTSKKNLFRQIAERHAAIPVLDELIPAILDKPMTDGIAVLVQAYLDRLSDSKAWIRIFQTELQRDPETFQPLLGSFLDELYRACGTYFSEMARRGLLTCACRSQGFRHAVLRLFSDRGCHPRQGSRRSGQTKDDRLDGKVVL
jgi:AcrR family transcriptional regulator